MEFLQVAPRPRDPHVRPGTEGGEVHRHAAAVSTCDVGCSSTQPKIVGVGIRERNPLELFDGHAVEAVPAAGLLDGPDDDARTNAATFFMRAAAASSPPRDGRRRFRAVLDRGNPLCSTDGRRGRLRLATATAAKEQSDPANLPGCGAEAPSAISAPALERMRASVRLKSAIFAQEICVTCAIARIIREPVQQHETSCRQRRSRFGPIVLRRGSSAGGGFDVGEVSTTRRVRGPNEVYSC
jgi:hypothetical protein